MSWPARRAKSGLGFVISWNIRQRKVKMVDCLFRLPGMSAVFCRGEAGEGPANGIRQAERKTKKE